MVIKKNQDRLWIEDLYKSIGNIIILAENNDDTSLRQSFVLLDNVVERTLRSYLETIIGIPVKNRSFENIIKMCKKQKQFKKIKNMFDKLLEYHEIRNRLYHSPKFHSVSRNILIKYVNDIVTIYTKMGLSNCKDDFLKNSNNVLDEVFHREESKRKELIIEIEILIKNKFIISPEIYEGDLLLGCAPFNFIKAYDNILNLVMGISERDVGEKKKIRILEIKKITDNMVYHSYLLSYYDSCTWFCFPEIISYRKNQIAKFELDLLKILLEKYKKNIDYRTAKSHLIIANAFDSLYTNIRNYYINHSDLS